MHPYCSPVGQLPTGLQGTQLVLKRMGVKNCVSNS